MENMKFSDSSSNSPPRKKKTRTVFTRQQIQYLENAFDRKKYFTNTERQKLASNLMLSETQVGRAQGFEDFFLNTSTAL